MISNRLIRQVVSWWSARCREKRLARAIPGYADTGRELAQRRRCHKPTRDVIEKRRELVNDSLRGV